jgi:hypothetical protein
LAERRCGLGIGWRDFRSDVDTWVNQGGRQPFGEVFDLMRDLSAGPGADAGGRRGVRWVFGKLALARRDPRGGRPVLLDRRFDHRSSIRSTQSEVGPRYR